LTPAIVGVFGSWPRERWQGMLRRIHPLRALATLVIFAGAIGLAQIPVPARHAWLSDFVIDALAACAGTGGRLRHRKTPDDRPEVPWDRLGCE